MNYLIISTLFITTCLIEIVFSQSIYNKQLYDRMLNNKGIRTTAVQPKWINQESLINVETILEETISPEYYIVGPGDQFSINIISSDGVFNYILEVTPTGELLLPLIGVIIVDKLSLKLAIEQIKILGKSKYENTKIEITLIKLRSFRVHVSGAIKESGFVVVSAIDRLSNVIKQAGGFVPLAKEFTIDITHQDLTSDTFNYLEYLRTGDMSQNPIIRNGDRINIPYGDIADESIEVKGAVKNRGYYIIVPGETLSQFIHRRIIFAENALLDKIYIFRGNNDVHEIPPTAFNQFILQPGDQINIQEELAVFVTGFVKNPGRYKYIIGFSVDDYLGLAGGNLEKGDQAKVKIQHIDNTVAVGVHQQIRRGDIIYVPQRNLNKLVGELSVLQILSYISTVILTYIAARQ